MTLRLIERIRQIPIANFIGRNLISLIIIISCEELVFPLPLWERVRVRGKSHFTLPLSLPSREGRIEKQRTIVKKEIKSFKADAKNGKLKRKNH
ncbi:MAG: hypothetical protein A2W07_00035 [candidate division Zixibacteria bacterium RBG_16_43_9]|nr:MAG: hypothetical protein A2W07_00035 [candidate division Zixibacteria bacterium RBG_16_43_9]